ncbi:MAG: low specificity L-threonine aldolase [Oscillospiraceae bacterium]|nr:low specificity L-threonine aldolase [Oscillospiraceae bacterium]
MDRLYFGSDYQEGAHGDVLARLCETNLLHTVGYGTDEFCAAARDKIRAACACPGAAVHFLVGGTQTNVTVIDALLRPWEGVVAAQSGHISTHEAGAVEFHGHKVLALPPTDGKLDAAAVRACCENYWADESREHIVMPGMVYVSQPSESGTLYSLAELRALRAVCDAYDMRLYVDGARLAYALACPENDVTLPDLAQLCDAFYIGGTKCGLLFGEAVVFPDGALLPHFFTTVKQHGALLAKGRLLGVQFDALFTNDLYFRLGASAIAAADRLRDAFVRAGCPLASSSPTNQVFVVLDDATIARLAASVVFEVWSRCDDTHAVVRFVTGWATTPADVDALIALL